MASEASFARSIIFGLTSKPSCTPAQAPSHSARLYWYYRRLSDRRKSALSWNTVSALF